MSCSKYDGTCPAPWGEGEKIVPTFHEDYGFSYSEGGPDWLMILFVVLVTVTVLSGWIWIALRALA